MKRWFKKKQKVYCNECVDSVVEGWPDDIRPLVRERWCNNDGTRERSSISRVGRRQMCEYLNPYNHCKFWRSK